MAAPTNVYVDPAIAANSGTGTSGDPYGDLQYALNNTTLGAGGTQINIKAGTDEILTAALSLASGFSGTPALGQPLIFRGYTSAANDGGIGGISGNGSVSIYNGSNDGLWFIDCKLHNCGSANVYTNSGSSVWSGITRCNITNTSGIGIRLTATPRGFSILGCEITDISGDGISLEGTAIENGIFVYGNYFANGTKDFAFALDSTLPNTQFVNNIVSVDGTSGGVRFTGNGILSPRIIHNSILSASGTGIGIDISDANGALNTIIASNAVEGFSGAGGIGYKFSTSARMSIMAANIAYNNTTNYSGNTDHLIDLGDYNEAASATLFAKSGANTFANRFVYFEPSSTGSIRAGAYPSGSRRDKGAVQHADPSGGSGGPSGRLLVARPTTRRR